MGEALPVDRQGEPQRGVIMQLRVARLCLDCEELHTENSCPVCASDRYAFLSTWLPVEERRRWPRSSSRQTPAETGVAAVVQTVSRWFRGEDAVAARSGPLTRRSDHVPPLQDFDAAPEAEPTPTHAEPQLTKRKA
jgi:hypothetical protein